VIGFVGTFWERFKRMFLMVAVVMVMARGRSFNRFLLYYCPDYYSSKYN